MSEPVLDALQEELTAMQKRIEELEKEKIWDAKHEDFAKYDEKLETLEEKIDGCVQKIRVVETRLTGIRTGSGTADSETTQTAQKNQKQITEQFAKYERKFAAADEMTQAITDANESISTRIEDQHGLIQQVQQTSLHLEQRVCDVV